MYSAMSRPYTTNHAHSSMGYEPYQTSEYDRAIQQAAERERAAEAARSRSSSTTTTTTTTSHIPIPAKSSTQLPRLPGLNDLFASKLLINPDSSSRESRRSPDYDDHRRDSVARGSYFDTLRPSDVSARPRTVITPPLLHASSPYGSQPKTSPLTIQSLCSAPEQNFVSPTSSLPTSPATSQSSNSSLMQPASHSQPTSPHELPPAFFGTSDLAPATYVYQAASAYEGVSYIHGRGPCHMYKGGYSIPTHIFQDPVNLTSSKILRKRLSVACSTCRKKKIKCEPGPEGCLQCKKAQKPCRIEPAKRRQKSAASAGFQAEKSSPA